MGALDPIAGISLERYADLAAKMKDCGGDLEVCAQIAEQNGVDRATWQAAMNGWNERMANPATAGTVALAYMPLYQAALAQFGQVATASIEDYAAMGAMLGHPNHGLDQMYAHFGINVNDWSQISNYWVDKLTKDNALAQVYGQHKISAQALLDAGQLPPVGRGAKPTNVTTDDVVAAAGNISDLPPVRVGATASILWSDGNKYNGRVVEAGKGQCLIEFSNGAQHWVSNKNISNE